MADISIGIVLSSLSRSAGGLFYSVRRPAIELATRGNKVSVYGVRDRYTFTDQEEWLPLRPQVFNGKGPESFRYASALTEAVYSDQLDIIHLHGIWQYPSCVTLNWREEFRRPLVISPHGMLDPWAVRNSRWKKRLAGLLYENRNLSSASCIRALNVEEAKAIRAYGLKNPIAILPNGVDPVPLCDAPGLISGVSRLDRKILLFVGRLHPKKGLEETLLAWSLLKIGNPTLVKNWLLVIAGWDEKNYLARLTNLVRSLDLEHEVHFTGALFGAEKHAAYAAASAFVLASHSEGLPMSVLEAWSYGIPVFMTASCNLSEAFALDAAIKITTDPENIARAFAEHLEDDQFRQIGFEGRKLVEEQFTWSKIAKGFNDLNHWLLGAGAEPDIIWKG